VFFTAPVYFSSLKFQQISDGAAREIPMAWQVYGHVPPAQRVLLFAKLMGLAAMVRRCWNRRGSDEGMTEDFKKVNQIYGLNMCLNMWKTINIDDYR
jgi:hypothetical protein